MPQFDLTFTPDRIPIACPPEAAAGIEQRGAFQATAQVTPAGRFEILAISAGSGNGWEFSEQCLRESLSLWENAHCYLDHAATRHSVRDLAGICSAPTWEPARQGITLQIKALGPAGPILTELGRQLLTGQDATPDVGFSADISFTAEGSRVTSIRKVHSLDLVLSPARGGQFIRTLNQRKEIPMTETTNNPCRAEPLPTDTFGNQHGSSTQAAPASLPAEAPYQAQLAREMEAVRSARVAMSAYLLDSGLKASSLPAAMTERIRKQFAGAPVDPHALQSAIEDARSLVSELTGALTVQGPGRIHGVFDTTDRLQAAVDDLFGVERLREQQGLKVTPLSGIRELYMLLTGDHDLHGGYHPERVQLAASADFSGLVKNALNKIVSNTWDELGRAGYDWWKKVVVVEHFNSIQNVTGTLVGTVGTLPVVNEGAEYTELAVGDSPETGTFYKYGGYIPLTLELIDRDETRKLKAYPRELAAAGLRKISALVAAIFTQSSGVGPTLADNGALFNATAVTTSGGHANLLTAALAADKWDLVCAAVYNQPMLVKNASGFYGSGPKMAINPRYLLVPRALQLTAMKIIYPTIENAANIFSENQQRGQPGDVITVPEWTDATDFAAVCDPRIAPAIYVGERFGIMPEIFIAGDNLSPAVFMNDEHRLKVRHFLACWVNDFRPLHKSNV